MPKSDLILHLDMDGVLTDFETAFKAISGGVPPAEYREKHGKKAESELFLDAGSQFWANERWQEGGPELLGFALQSFKTVRILSSAGTGKDWKRFKQVALGKSQWLVKNAPMIPQQNILIVPFPNLKARHAGPDRILVDDRAATIEGWNKRGGIGILHHHSNWPKTVEELRAYAAGPVKLKEIVESL